MPRPEGEGQVIEAVKFWKPDQEVGDLAIEGELLQPGHLEGIKGNVYYLKSDAGTVFRLPAHIDLQRKLEGVQRSSWIFVKCLEHDEVTGYRYEVRAWKVKKR